MADSQMNQWARIASLVGFLCAVAPASAHAGVPQWPQKQMAGETHTTLRKAPKPPGRDQVHRGGVDGTITLIQFISNRRPHHDRHKDQNTPQGSVAQVRASWEHAACPSGPLTARVVGSLPPHRESTHLSI